MAKKVKLATILRAGQASLAGSGTAGTPPGGNQLPVQIQNIPNFSLPQGSNRLLTPYFHDAEGDTIYYQKASTPTNNAKITIDAGGNIRATADCPLGTYQVKAQFSDVAFPPVTPPGTAFTQLADIPELFFLVGYPETEELGIYICDPQNRVSPGDLWWLTGARLQRHSAGGGGNWAPQQTVALTFVTGTMPPGVTFDASTARLIYDGSNISGAHSTCTARLTCNGYSKDFRIRVLRPTVICTNSPVSLPAVLAGIRTVPADGVAWVAMRSDSTTNGSTDSTPRVCLFADAFTPRQTSNNWLMGDASTNSDYRYMYICGVPGNISQLGKPQSQESKSFEAFVATRARSIHYKNFRLGNTGMKTLEQESGFPNRWTIQKCDWMDRNPASEESNVENGSHWAPNGFPSEVNDFRFFCVNCRMFQGGYQYGTKHCFYVETNGYTFGDWNNLRLEGGNGCSLIQQVLGHARIRNNYLSFCATPDDPYSQPMWATEMIDPHAHVETIVYNNELIGGRDSARTGPGAGGTQNAQLAFLSNRRAAKGSNTPNYPSLEWSNPATSGGPTSPRLGTFPTGPATYKNPAFWTAVNAGGLTNAENTYLFRNFYSYNTVRHAALTPNKTNIMRIDGTHPCEAEEQFGTPTSMLGCPTNWVERCTVWLMNNTWESWTAAQTDTVTGSAFERYDSQNVTVIEDGTKYESRDVVLDNAETGVVRIRVSSGVLCDASTTVKDRIGWDALMPPTGYDTWNELVSKGVVVSFTADPVKWPPAKWPAGALGSNSHPERALNEPWGVPRIVDVGGNRSSDTMTLPRVNPPDWFML